MKILSRLIESIKSGSAANRQATEEIQRILDLPFEEVKRHALALLADSRRFRSVMSDPLNSPEIEALGPVLKDFFSRFESIKELNGDFSVSRSAVSESTLRIGFLKIGTDFASSELVVRPGEDRVVIVTDSEHALDGLPTIYHNICLLE